MSLEWKSLIKKSHATAPTDLSLRRDWVRFLRHMVMGKREILTAEQFRLSQARLAATEKSETP